MSTVLLGIVFSTAFLASGPIIVDAVINFALPFRLRSSINENGIIYFSTHINQGAQSRSDIDEVVRELINTNLIWFKEILHSTATPWVYPWQDGYLITDERLNFISITGIDKHIKFVSGDWPNSQTFEKNSVKAAIPQPMASAYAIGIGDQLPISHKFDESQPLYSIEVSGIYEPSNAGDPYWLITSNPFQVSENQRFIAEYGVILREKDFQDLAERLFKNSNHRLTWLGIINPSTVNSDNTQDIIQGIESVRESLSNLERKVTFKTNLDIYLENFEARTSEIIPPLYLLIGEVAFLGLYYVLMVAGLSIRQIEGEMAILASRGAKFRQLLGIQVFDATLISMISFIVGPIFAHLIIRSLAYFGPLSDISQVDWVTRIPRASWLAAGISVLACLTAQFIPMLSILRRSVIQHQNKITRRSDKPWWHRYYLDVFLFAIGLGAIWRLSLYGSISRINQGNLDWLLLLAPLALLIGSAAILLRLFPLVLRVLASMASQGRGLTAALALRQTARDPTQAAGLILLFTLAMALGILSTGLNATLEKSESDRARYATGGEARISFDNFIPPSTLDTMPQVTASSAVWRGRGRANVRSYRNIPQFSILAIEPLSFAAVSQFRNDYTDDYIGYVLGQLIVDPEQLPVSAIPLPGTPTHLGIWIADPNPDRSDLDLLDFVSIRAKILSSEGQNDIIDLAPASNLADYDPNNQVGEEASSSKSFYFFSYIPNGYEADLDNESGLYSGEPVWRFFEADLPAYNAQGYPLALHSIWIKIRRLPTESVAYSSPQRPLIIDDLSIKNTDESLQVVEGFEELTTIWQTDSALSVASYTKNEITHSGQASLRLFLGAPDSSNWTVLSPAQTKRLRSIPILASPDFLEMTSLKVGDQFAAYINGTALILEIRNSVNFFPTMYETENNGFVVISRDALLGELNRSSRAPTNFNEIWFRVDETREIQGILSSLPQATRNWDIETEQLLYKSDPLTLGLRSVIFLGYSLTLVLCMVGFATHFYLNARKRAAVYSILRALGLSTSQLYASLVLEQIIIIISGLGLGIILGSMLNKMILPGLPISFGDLPAIPPFIPQSEWSAVIRIILMLLGGFLFILASGTFFLWRIKLHQVLRIGEE